MPALILLALLCGWQSGCADAQQVEIQPTASLPQAQGGDPRSVETTQVIRNRLMAQEHLSLHAKHIRVVTNDGRVLLSGSVASAQEKAFVMRIARLAAEDLEVDDHLAIADPPPGN